MRKWMSQSDAKSTPLSANMLIQSDSRSRAFERGFISSGAYYNAVPFLKCQNTNCGVPIERRVVMRLTFPHTTMRNGSGFPGQREVSAGQDTGSRGSPDFLTTINNRIRSAIGDFVSHSLRPRRGQSGAGPLCAESFLLRCILAPFDPASPARGEIIMKPHVSRSICDFGRWMTARRRRARFRLKWQTAVSLIARASIYRRSIWRSARIVLSLSLFFFFLNLQALKKCFRKQLYRWKSFE